LLIIVISQLVRVEKRLAEISRIQHESIPATILAQLRSEQVTSDLFRRFLAEDFSRSEQPVDEQEQEFQKWKATKQ
jgi:hypothetical protein